MIPVNEPLLDGNEKKYLVECIETGWISSEGPFVERFENEMAAYVGRKYGIAVANGTAALDVAIAALEIEPGDEIILPTFTIISCVNAIIHAGGIPVVVDCEPDTWNMNVSHVEEKITPKTKAIMAVHIFGLPVDMEPLIKIANNYGLQIIEDAAQAIGLTCNNKECGSFGDISTFSFYPNKHVTTGEGGMVFTDDARLAERSRSLRNLCFNNKKRFVHDELGWNYRMTNMQAALGLAQLERLNEFVGRKRYMGKRYNELLSGLSGVKLPLVRTDYAENIYWVFGLVLDGELGIDAVEAMSRLAKKEIGTRPFFCPMHMQPILKRMGLFENESFPVAENLYQQGFYIPSGMTLTDEQIERVSSAVKEIID